MAYVPIDRHKIDEFLKDIAARKEFCSSIIPPPSSNLEDSGLLLHKSRAYLPPNLRLPSAPTLNGLQFHGAQLFVRGFASPYTPYTRLLLNWQTGTGKSIAAVGIAQQFIQQFRSQPRPGQG